MKIKLHVWRQPDPKSKGSFVEYIADDVSEHMSFLEMLDLVNEKIILQGGDPIAFDHDCREGICGMCGFMINGEPHGPLPSTTVCQLHMRHFDDGDELWLEPWRATAFPVLKDLVVNRGAFDRIIAAGGFVSVRTGSPQDANAILIPKQNADRAMDAAECIACGACVAVCPNASAMLFTSAKVAHLGLLPQGQPERYTRVVDMLQQHDTELFGHCTNHGACQNACPKDISVDFIARLNRDLRIAKMSRPEDAPK
jgi:succinate dehydrogenase / fumarate reductase iron-sulfur subunit